MSASESTPAHDAHAEGAFNPGETIMHHITDSREIEIPFTSHAIHLPKLEVAGIDVSITRNVVMMWIACAILLTLFVLAARRAKDAVPRGLRGGIEMLILFVRDDIVHRAIPHGGEQYMGYLLTTFFFILSCNFIGLIPGMSTPTSNISVTAALALIAFLMIQFAGIREQGVVQHFKNLIPPGLPKWLLPIMIPVEFLGMFTKPFALCVRLFANMTAGHVAILSLIFLIFILKTIFAAVLSVPFALFVYVLEILVAFIQAFIFTMLAALFIGMSAHPAH